MTGAGPGSWSFGDLNSELQVMAVATKALRPVGVKVKKLSDNERSWGEKSKQTIVFVP
jgi:hypothetical protein